MYVSIDSGKEFMPPMRVEFPGTATTFTIRHDERDVSGRVVSSLPVLALGTEYRLEVDGREIATGKIRADNWYMVHLVLVVLLAILAGLCFVLYLVLGLVSDVWNFLTVQIRAIGD